MNPDHLFFACVNILLAWSVYVVMMTGALSFASAAFMAIGCYAAGYCTVRLGWPLQPALFAGAALAACLSVPIGLPTLRLKGVYFILATIGITISTQVVIENIDALGGSTGFAGMVGVTPWHALAAVVVVGMALSLAAFTPLQRILDAIREDARVASSLGVNAVFVKVAVFAIGAAIAGYAGGLYGHYLVFVRPDSFGIMVGIFATFYVILGGANNPWGPALGAVILTLLPEYIAGLKEWRPTVFGLAIVLMLWLRPEGLVPLRLRTALSGGKGAP